MTGIRFVPQTGTKHDDGDTRRIIRRHVMVGKNRGRTPHPKQPATQGAAVFRAKENQDSEERMQSSSTIPGRVGTDLSFLEFADSVDPALMNDTLLFCSAANENMFALAPCMAFNAPDTLATCLARLSCDALYVNVLVMGTQCYLDKAFRNTSSELRGSCLHHYGKAISILRERLANAEKHQTGISDITINCVMILAMHALSTGQYETAKNHVAGVGRLVGITAGGVKSFEDHDIVDLLRCDISISLATGQTPVLFPGSSCESMFPLPEFCDLEEVPKDSSFIVKAKLAQLWNILLRFCAMVNKAVADQRKIPERMMLDTMAAVMYRLLDMPDLTSWTDETIRLAMLSFCASVFLHWGRLHLPFDWLQSEYKRQLDQLMQGHSASLDPGLILWLFTTYGITFSPLSGENVAQIQDWVSGSQGKGLDAVRSFLWIDIVCESPAQAFFREVGVLE